MTAPQRAARAVGRPGGPALQATRGVVVSVEPSAFVDDEWFRPRVVIGGVGNGNRAMDFSTAFQRDIDLLGVDIIGQPVKVSFLDDGSPLCEFVIVIGARP